jgi:hypothetical protein
MKKSNDYANLIADYDKIPKAVFAAIAVSQMVQLGDNIEFINDALKQEWYILYRNGIVPQKPHGDLSYWDTLA